MIEIKPDGFSEAGVGGYFGSFAESAFVVVVQGDACVGDDAKIGEAIIIIIANGDGDKILEIGQAAICD